MRISTYISLRPPWKTTGIYYDIPHRQIKFLFSAILMFLVLLHTCYRDVFSIIYAGLSQRNYQHKISWVPRGSSSPELWK